MRASSSSSINWILSWLEKLDFLPSAIMLLLIAMIRRATFNTTWYRFWVSVQNWLYFVYSCISIKLLYQWNIDFDYYRISNERTIIIIQALLKRLMFIACILHKPFWVYLDYVCFKCSVCFIEKLTTTGPLIV